MPTLSSSAAISKSQKKDSLRQKKIRSQHKTKKNIETIKQRAAARSARRGLPAGKIQKHQFITGSSNHHTAAPQSTTKTGTKPPHRRPSPPFSIIRPSTINRTTSKTLIPSYPTPQPKKKKPVRHPPLFKPENHRAVTSIDQRKPQFHLPPHPQTAPPFPDTSRIRR
ncbi:hypothetical protein Droror1_Dr00006412 [Drosera rotundifolia]